jgi:hypothetical protein
VTPRWALRGAFSSSFSSPPHEEPGLARIRVVDFCGRLDPYRVKLRQGRFRVFRFVTE